MRRATVKPPKYAKIVKADGQFSCVLLCDDHYYREAGDWSVRFVKKNGEFFVNSSNSANLKHLHGLEIVRTTRKKWQEDNQRPQGAS